MKRNIMMIFALGLSGLLLMTGISCHGREASIQADLQTPKESPEQEPPEKEPEANIFQWDGWTFYLAAETPATRTRELKTYNMLSDIIKSYDLTPWIREKVIHIDAHAISQSNPLTINTRHNDDPEMLLATFVHEQIHKLELEYPDDFHSAMAEVEQLFPDLPPELASAPRAAYRHFIVNYFEIDALKRLLGEAAGLVVIGRKDKNVWIYETILTGNNADRLKTIYEKYPFGTAYQ